MPEPTTTATHPLMNCPACGQPINARMTMTVALDLDGERLDQRIDASVRLTGLSVQHDCNPKATR